MNRDKKRWLYTALTAATLLGTFSPGLAFASDSVNGDDPAKQMNGNYPFTNFALGKPYTVTQGIRDAQLMAYEERTSRDNGTEYELTDGKIGSDQAKAGESAFLDKNWIGYSRQVSRAVTVDLGEPKFVNEVRGGFLQERPAAIELPRYVKVYASDDGVSWHLAGERKTETVSATQQANRQVLGVSNVNVYARYIRLEFEVSMFSFMDELEVIGKEQKGGRPVSTLPRAEQPQNVAPPTREEAGGVHHMYITFLYPEQTGNGKLGKWTRDDFKPVLTHVNESGQSDGWMFDSVLALSASGGSDYRTDYKQQESWQGIIDKLFVKQSEMVPPEQVTNSYLQELEEATKEAKTAIGEADRKTKVVVGIPFPDPSSAKWGILDGRDIHFNPAQVGEEAAYENRLAAVSWFVGEVTDRFAEADFRHLELAGFYWIHEEISFQTTHEEKLMKAISAAIHVKNKKLFWVPFYMANGTNFWKELGFDAVMMQPNYYFSSRFGPNEGTGKLDLSRLQNSIALSKQTGMSVEVEGDYHMSWKGWAPDYDGQLYNDEYSRRKYYAYLNELKKEGFDQAPLVYYLGAKPVLKDFMASGRQEVRRVYEETSRFVSGAYAPIALPEDVIPLPAGDTWTTPIQLEAVDGYAYTHYFPLAQGESKWLKFPIKAGEDWKVTLTPLDGASLAMETRHWGPTQTAHSGFSYNKTTTEQSMLVRNPDAADSAIMLRVFASGANPGGKFKLTLTQPIEDGSSMMNAMELPNKGAVTGTAAAGQEIWYKIAGLKSYSLNLVPQGGADFELQLFWDANSGTPQAKSDQPAGHNETIVYNNAYAPNFLYYVKVKAKTAGDFTLYNGIAP